MATRPGFPKAGLEDWECPECTNVNFGKRTECNRCRKPKPDEKTSVKKTGIEIGKQAAEKSKGLFSADDWMCTKCGNVNWARRKTCNTCNAPKFTEVEQRTGLGGGFNEREGVEYKEREASDDEFDDFGRKKKKSRPNAEESDSYRTEKFVGASASTKTATSRNKSAEKESEEDDDDEDDPKVAAKYDLGLDEEEEEDDDGDTDKYKLFDDDEEDSASKQDGQKTTNSTNVPPKPSSRKDKDDSSDDQISQKKVLSPEKRPRKRYPGSKSSDESSSSSDSSSSTSRSSSSSSSHSSKNSPSPRTSSNKNGHG